MTEALLLKLMDFGLIKAEVSRIALNKILNCGHEKKMVEVGVYKGDILGLL